MLAWFALTAIALAPMPRAIEQDCGLFYADSSSAWLAAPEGWLLDCKAGRDQGAIVVLYRKGESWKTGKAVMYANIARNDGAKRLTVSDAISGDSSSWSKNSSDVVVTVRPSLRTKGGDSAAVRGFSTAKFKDYEAVAYIPCESGVWLLVLTARSPSDFDAAYPDFAKLVASYAPGPVVKQQ